MLLPAGIAAGCEHPAGLDPLLVCKRSGAGYQDVWHTCLPGMCVLVPGRALEAIVRKGKNKECQGLGLMQ